MDVGSATTIETSVPPGAVPDAWPTTTPAALAATGAESRLTMPAEPSNAEPARRRSRRDSFAVSGSRPRTDSELMRGSPFSTRFLVVGATATSRPFSMRHSTPANPRIKQIAQRVTHGVQRQYERHDGQARNRGHVVRHGDELPAVTEHRPPVGLWGLCAKAQKR